MAGLPANMPMIEAATTSEQQYDQAVLAFRDNPIPDEPLVEWVCRDNPDYLDLAGNPLVMNPAG